MQRHPVAVRTAGGFPRALRPRRAGQDLAGTRTLRWGPEHTGGTPAQAPAATAEATGAAVGRGRRLRVAGLAPWRR